MPSHFLVPNTLLRSLHKHRTGIYATIIFHLCVLAALMGLKVNALSHQIASEIAINFDNEKEEQERRREEARSIQNELAQEIRSQIAAEQSEAARLRNAAVNEETPSDNRDKVLAENEELQRRIASTYRMMREQNADGGASTAAKETAGGKAYAGPSVLSYFVKGRKAAYLPVPVYKCEAGGRVVVIISVAETGRVADAQIDRQASAADECLRQSALDAARRSRFNVEAGAAQQGSITYQFISQYNQ